MSRGLGKVQQNILATLTAKGDNWTYNWQLSEQLGKSPRQTLNALAAIERRGLIEMRRDGNHTSARTLQDDGSTRPEAPLEIKARQRSQVYETERFLYFHAMDEVIARGASFTAEDVRAVVNANRVPGKPFPANHNRIMAGVFSTYLRKRYIEKIGTEKNILAQPINRYAPLPGWRNRRQGRGL